MLAAPADFAPTAKSLLAPNSSFRLGPFSVDGSTGQLLPCGPEAPAFRFFWHSCPVQVRMTHDGLDLVAMAGRIPSSVRAGQAPRAASQREELFEMLRELPRTLPEGWRAELKPDHSLRIHAAVNLNHPLTPVELLQTLTLFVLEAGPFLDVLAESGMSPMTGLALA